MTDYNPAKVETDIRDCANRIAKGVPVCAQRYSEYLAADRVFDIAYAHAYMHADGAAHERKYQAVLATHDQREARDVAEAAYKFADRKAKALEDELRALQSLGASIRQAYAVAGRGEGA